MNKPENFDFGGGAAGTVIHPAVLVAMLVTIVLILLRPRQYLVGPFLLIAFLVPPGQQIYVGGMHWAVLRIVILAGCFRMLLEKFKGEGKLFPNGLNRIDRAFILWAFYAGLAPILVFRSAGEAVYQMGLWLQTLGGYFFLRYMIRNVDDITTAAKIFALLVVILATCMTNEHLRDINIFGYTQSMSFVPEVRDGRIRAQACFGHSILAGCFGATLMPILFWLWKSGSAKWLATIGMTGSVMMVLFSASSTPSMALLGGVGALFLWPVRTHMRWVRWGLVLMVIGLQLAMAAPIWFIINHVNPTGSSDAYDRAILIDTFVRHFADWWLIGTNQTASWGKDMWDLSNQFVAVGERGGLVCFVCFISLISRSFSQLGKLRRQIAGDKSQEWLCWSLCAVLFAHILAYFGVNYFDQSSIWWFAFLAMVSAGTGSLIAKPPPSPHVEEKEVPAFEFFTPA